MTRAQINEKDLKRLEAGKESYGSLAKKYGLSKAGVYHIHIKKLENNHQGHSRRA